MTRKAPVKKRTNKLTKKDREALQRELESALISYAECKLESDLISSKMDDFKSQAKNIADLLGEDEQSLLVEGKTVIKMKKVTTRRAQLNKSVPIEEALTPHQILKCFKPTVRDIENFIEGADSEETQELLRKALTTTATVSWRIDGPKGELPPSLDSEEKRNQRLNEVLQSCITRAQRAASRS